MSDVFVRVDPNDERSVRFEVRNLPPGATLQPAFRLRRSNTKEFVTPKGFSKDPFRFEWPSVREGEAVIFSGPRAHLDWITEDDALTFEVPEVAFRARFSWNAAIGRPSAPEQQKARPRLGEILQALETEPNRAPEPAQAATTVKEAQPATDQALADAPPTPPETETENVRPPAAKTEGPSLFPAAATGSTFGASPLFPRRTWIVLLLGMSVLLVPGAVLLTGGYIVYSGSTVYFEHLKTEDERLRALAQQLEAQSSKDEAERLKTSRQDENLKARLDKLASEEARLKAEEARLASLRGELDEERAKLNREKEALAQQQLADGWLKKQPFETVLPSSPPTDGTATIDSGEECDRLAANPTDRHRRKDTGVGYGMLAKNPGPAIDACTRATEADTNEPRYIYQLARALQSSEPNRARQLFKTAADMGYAAAWDNLGWMMIQEQRDYVTAAQYFRNGVALKDPDAMISLAELILIRRAPGTPFTAAELYYRAADAGHANALKTVSRIAGRDPQALGNLLVTEPR